MHFIIEDAHKYIVSSFDQAFYGMIAHPAGDQTVNTGGGSSPLDMSQDTNPDFGIG